MLKKIIVGILCFVILAATGGGIYIYTLDWNKHKTLVAQRFSQITGLKAVIEGNLNVKLFPSPKFSASKVKFFPSTGGKTPLVIVNDLTANVDLMPLLDNNFVVKSMTLSKATAFVEINEKGVSNWDGVGKNTSNKSGNIEVSFNDVQVSSSTLSYKNLQDNSQFDINNVSANISAPALSGPYKTSGKFIHNNSEIRFKGDIAKNKGLVLKTELTNASSGSKVTLDGTFGETAKGTVTLDTRNFFDLSNIIWGKDAISDRYSKPLFVSFQYNLDKALLKLDNFTTKFDKNTAGSGTVIINKGAEIPQINASFDLTKFDLNIFEDLAQDIIKYTASGKKFAESPFAGYDFSLSAKAASAWYNNVEARNLTMAFNLKQNILDITRFGVVMPGESILKTVGRINLNNGIEYMFNQAFDTKDLRTFASVFNIDLAKLASADNKKAIFKRAEADVKIVGNLDSIKISLPKASIDATDFHGNLGVVKKDKIYVLADMDASKIILDKYLLGIPDNLKNAPLKDKFVYQMNLLPWNRDFNVDAEISIASLVYNDVPMEKLYLHFTSEKDTLKVNDMSIANLAGADVNLKMDAQSIFTSPQFNELSFDVKTDNLPLFTSTLGIDTGNKGLFKRKLFALQGALSGRFDEFSLSSVQKFGDTEFAYTGVVRNDNKNPITINGDLELKTNNFNLFVKALGLNYSADIPVTTFALSSKIKGSNKLFALDTLNAYLGANAIKGSLQFDNTGLKPILKSNLSFDRFDADRWFNLNKHFAAAPVAQNTDTFLANGFSDKKIDYSALAKIDFDIDVVANQLTFRGKTYSGAKTKLFLKDSLLKVSSFDATIDKSLINFRFDLNAGDMPRIDGYFNVKDLKIPGFGGSMYAFEEGFLTAEGTFNSAASSEKDFFENLNSKGKLSLANTAIRGWDLDIIKFELEQRKSLAGFEDTVANSLKSGKSSFSRIRGAYNISKGFVVADSVIWESPVVNMNMKFDLNLSDWIFNAVFNAVYHNASFSDILKFTFDGNLANPKLTLDLEESIKRIGDIEDKIKNARQYKEKAKMEKIGDKLKALQRAVDGALQDINRLTLEVVRFKPVTQNENVVSVYQDNLKTISQAEINIKKMKDQLNNYPDEETLMNIESELGAEKAKLKYIPKVLEENYVVDSKYIFDDTFNKIAWIYNLSQNNYAYHRSLTDVYMAQVELLNSSTTPVSEENVKKLQDGLDKTKEIMDNMSELHSKIRDNYLNIIDSVKVSQMKENNEIAHQALETLLTYSKQLYNDIVINIDDFRAILSITSRDYDQYMLYPPETTADIDIKQPTLKTGSGVALPKNDNHPEEVEPKSDTISPAEDEKTTETSKVSTSSTLKTDADKKKESFSIALQANAANGLSDVLGQLKNRKKLDKGIQVASNLDFGGLSGIFKSNINTETSKTISSSDISSKTLADSPSSSKANTSLKDIAENSVTNNVATPKEEKAIVTAKKNIIEKEDTSNITANTSKFQISAHDDNILAKTKAAITKILAKVKKQEKALEKDFAENNVKNMSKLPIKANDKPKEIAELSAVTKSSNTLVADVQNIPTLPSVQNNVDEKKSVPSSLKVNPVIALNIGKEDASKFASVSLPQITTKGKFKKVSNKSNNKNAYPTVLSAAQIDKFSNFIDEAINGEKKVEPDNTSALLDILPRPQHTSPADDVNNLTDAALVAVSDLSYEKEDTSHHDNLYVIKNTTPFSSELSGQVGKEMLKDIHISSPVKPQQKYLFAVNTSFSAPTTGQVAKKFSLAD